MAILRVTTQSKLDAALDAAKPYDEIYIEGAGYFELMRNPKEPTATVRAWGSATVRASGSATVHASETATVHASKYVAVQKMAPTVNVSGDGVVIEKPAITTVEQWCAYYDLPIVDGIVTVYKAVRDDYRSARGLSYEPGSVPVATDWDGGRDECGGGLHFCARPIQCLSFDADATKFLACPVAVVDMRVPREGDAYPTKVKARAVAHQV